ncbi:plastidial pyruvate kinase 4, chloroplastic isoform X3, partial [Tanacetum coccineum]
QNNGNDEHESAVGAYSDDQSLTVPNISSESYDLEKEIVASSLYPTEDYSQHTKILGNHGNLLDKLKAVHMQKLEKPCRVLMDLAGPKLRTGRMKVGPCVMKISPKRNAYGNVINPAQVWVAQKGAGPPPAHVSLNAVIYVDGQEFLKNLAVGDAVRFSDARGKQRFLKISKKEVLVWMCGGCASCRVIC